MKTQGTMSAVSRAIMIACCALAGVSGGAFAQEEYPTRPVEVIVPSGPGGGADQAARMIASYLESELKASFPVINVPGSSGITGTQQLLLAPADGYSFAVGGEYYKLIGPGAPWTLDDFIPLAIAIKQPSMLYVAENSRFKSWADVEKEARAKPNTIKIAITGFGSVEELHMKVLAAKGIKLVAVPFGSPSERFASILGGHTDLLYEQPGDVKSYLSNKQMRPLLSFTAERIPAFKDVPTAKELGYDLTIPETRWVYMKAGTDPQRVKVITDALTKMSATPEYRAWLEGQLGAPDSYVPVTEARQFLSEVLSDVREEAAAAEVTPTQ